MQVVRILGRHRRGSCALIRQGAIVCRGVGKVQQTWTGRGSPRVRVPACAGSTMVAPTLGWRMRGLVWPLSFTVGFSATAFAGATVLQPMLKRWESSRDSTLREVRQWCQRMNIPQSIVALAPLLAVNFCVFGAWQLMPRSVALRHWFTHVPAQRRSLPMLLACFSHQGAVHFAFNMLALYSFGSTCLNTLGFDGPTFTALFLSAGVISSLGSSAVAALTKRNYFRPSLGASGGVIALASLVACVYPNAQFSLIFLPFVSFSASKMMLALVSVDVAGLVLGWRMFDHAAHLTGAALGFWYVYLGGHLLQRDFQMLVYKYSKV